GAGDAARRLRDGGARGTTCAAGQLGLEVDSATYELRAEQGRHLAGTHPSHAGLGAIGLLLGLSRGHGGIAVHGERVHGLLGFGSLSRFGEGAVEPALVGVWRVHSPTASTALVGRDGFVGPSRVAIRYADRIVAIASRSGRPAAYAASPSSEVV